MERKGDTYHFDGQVKVDMDVFVNQPANATPETGEYSHPQQPYGRLTGFDPKYFPDGKLGEKQLFLRFKQPAGKGYMVVLYPRLKNEDPPATFESLAENAVRTTTPLSTDYSFLESHPFTFKDDRVSFDGTAASVRFYKSGKVVVNNCEGQAQFTVAGKTISGHGAFRVVLEDGKVAREKLSEDAQVEVR
jgi:hypothetical protein